MAVRLVNGDCFDELRAVPDNSVNLVLTDPPYSSPVKNAYGRETVKRLSDLSLQEAYFRTLKAEFERVLADGGGVAIFCDEAYYAVLYGVFYDWRNESMIVWDKGRLGMGRPVRRCHELVFIASPGRTTLSTDRYSHIPSVVRCAPVKEHHPAEKPVELLDRIVSCLSEPGGVVLDPFMGSGSTGVACARAGRSFYGIELDRGYYEMARTRVERGTVMAETCGSCRFFVADEDFGTVCRKSRTAVDEDSEACPRYTEVSE